VFVNVTEPDVKLGSATALAKFVCAPAFIATNPVTKANAITSTAGTKRKADGFNGLWGTGKDE
jgi:hypothetical protein